MQKTTYFCDTCKRIIGDKPHISLGLNKGLSGIALPPNTEFIDELPGYLNSNWTIKKVKSGFMHFHTGECVKKYFDKLLKEALNPKKKSKSIVEALSEE